MGSLSHSTRLFGQLENRRLCKMTSKGELLLISIRNRDHATFTKLLEQFTADELNKHNGNKNGLTPLHYACGINNHQVVSQFLKINNIDVNVRSIQGMTPLMVAISFNSVECMELMAANKNVDIFTWFYYYQTIEGREEDEEHMIKYLRKKRME